MARRTKSKRCDPEWRSAPAGFPIHPDATPGGFRREAAPPPDVRLRRNRHAHITARAMRVDACLQVFEGRSHARCMLDPFAPETKESPSSRPRRPQLTAARAASVPRPVCEPSIIAAPGKAGEVRFRRTTLASSPVGIREVRSGRAQAPQTRGDNEGCAAGLAPHALLFAAGSPVRGRKIARIPQKSTCRSHQWSAGSWLVRVSVGT